ncbi:MarR family transcriptional regulator [Planobispora siamensis]|uniref:HTH marR-type domain-containing protein n=1 Tax=Planobispora siamensis TaxID=936338 RepID=A0A8J3SK40_9ACTN|nr:hypothetical protein Psi01_17230 [Planobispora siamensis]
MTAGELAERANLTTGAVTGALNRLERAGYATRQADPADRRRVRIVPDEEAAARVAAVYVPFYQRLAEMSAGYSAEEMGTLTDWFTRAATAMRTTLEEIRQGGTT